MSVTRTREFFLDSSTSEESISILPSFMTSFNNKGFTFVLIMTCEELSWELMLSEAS